MLWVKRTIQLVVFVVAAAMVGGMYFADTLNGDAAEHARLTEEYRTLVRGTATIRESRNRLEIERDALADNPDFLEKTIRQDMGYVRSNEIVLFLAE